MEVCRWLAKASRAVCWAAVHQEGSRPAALFPSPLLQQCCHRRTQTAECALTSKKHTCRGQAMVRTTTGTLSQPQRCDEKVCGCTQEDRDPPGRIEHLPKSSANGFDPGGSQQWRRMWMFNLSNTLCQCICQCLADLALLSECPRVFIPTWPVRVQSTCKSSCHYEQSKT